MKLEYFLKKLFYFPLLLIPSFLFYYDLSIESIYLDNFKCEIHLILKNSSGLLPDNVYSSGKISLKVSSIKRKISFSLNQIDPNKELNSSKQLDFNTKHKLKKDEQVEAILENINNNNLSNNSKSVLLSVKSCAKRESEGYKKQTEEKYIDHSPFDKHFSFSINDIPAPKSVYLYGPLPPQEFRGNINIDWNSREPDAEGIKIEFLGSNDRVLKKLDLYGPAGNYKMLISEMIGFSDSQVRDMHFFNVKATLMLKDGSYSQNSKRVKLNIILVSGYYYQDWQTRGVQILKLNNERGPVLISDLTENDRESKMYLNIETHNACPRDYPVLRDMDLKFYTTGEDGRQSTSPNNFGLRLSENQNSYSFTIKDLIQKMGLQWSARWYFISVQANYACYKEQSGEGVNVRFPQRKETNAINIRFFVPIPLL